MRALQDLSQRIDKVDGLEPLIDAILQGLDDIFGFTHSAILLPGEHPGMLVTIATHGYAENGAGAEARFGEGIAAIGEPLTITWPQLQGLGVLAEAQEVREMDGMQQHGTLRFGGSVDGGSHESQVPVPVTRPRTSVCSHPCPCSVRS